MNDDMIDLTVRLPRKHAVYAAARLGLSPARFRELAAAEVGVTRWVEALNYYTRAALLEADLSEPLQIEVGGWVRWAGAGPYKVIAEHGGESLWLYRRGAYATAYRTRCNAVPRPDDWPEPKENR